MIEDNEKGLATLELLKNSKRYERTVPAIQEDSEYVYEMISVKELEAMKKEGWKVVMESEYKDTINSNVIDLDPRRG